MNPKAIFGGLTVYFGMAVGTYMYLRSTKPPAASSCQHHPTKEGEEEVFDRIADIYDNKIGFDETVMGVKLLRWWLMRSVEGDVLEVSAGTGRNLPYYNYEKLRSLTLTDTSRQMLLNAYEKFKVLKEKEKLPHPEAVHFTLGDGHRLCSSGATSSSSSGGGSNMAAGNAVAAAQQPAAPGGDGPDGDTRFGPAMRTPQTFESHSFDYVVDTFGLCSHDDPVQVLKEMARVCKPGGKLILLEHGRSSWGFINNILDNGAQQHKEKWGCYWNKDILGLIKQAGLRVESVSRWHFGTTYCIVAEPAAVQTWRRT